MVEVIKIFTEFSTECITLPTLSEALDEVAVGQETIIIDLDNKKRYNYTHKGELYEEVNLECEEEDDSFWG